MRHVYEILRLTFEAHRSQREIAASLGVSQGHVNACLARFRAAGLPWPLPSDLDEAGLEGRLYARPTPPASATRPVPLWATIHRELKRAGVTLQLLWLEYQHAHEGTPERDSCYQYTQFCQLYHAWTGHLDPVLRQEHKAGDRVFVDYAGPTVSIIDHDTGEVQEAQIFVAALGASHLLFVEATWTQQLPDWIASHVRMFEFYGGVVALIVPDNLRSGVTIACFYEPTLNATYQEFAAHYATAILPTRVARPRDKAKVETGVLITEREILAPLRDHRFTSLAALNAAIAERLRLVNDRPFQKLAGCRRSVFETVERGALRPLPPERYEFAEWKTAKVHIDYHIAVEGHFYSVPHRLIKEIVRVRLTATMIEVLLRDTRVAVHRRAVGPGTQGRYTTEPAHRPKSHQAHLEWTPERFVRWAGEIGPHTAVVVTHILEHWPHPEQGYRACLGLLSLSRRFTPPRLEAACSRAQAAGTMSYRSISSILRTGLDHVAIDEPPALHLPPAHTNVRGAEYYREDDPGTREAPHGARDLDGPPSRLSLDGDSSC
jgi:transposase